MINNKVIIILGPTASGKTKLSLDLAEKINGEIISADSMQIYKHLNIGTAKPTFDEMRGIKHYLMDIIDPDEFFNVSMYKKKAIIAIEEIKNKGKMPIVVGGTGLYINSLIYNIEFEETIADYNYRNSLERKANEKGNEYVYNMLIKNDSEAARKIHPNNLKRVIRALEVFHVSGRKISEMQKNSRNQKSKFEFFLFGTYVNRETLYERIEARVDIMFESGFLGEVKDLLNKNYFSGGTALQAIGYKEIYMYLNGKVSLDEAKELIKRNTRRYAKRQMTWFRKIEDITWLNQEKLNNVEDILKRMQ